MTIKVYYLNSCKIFKGSKANEKAKAFASELSKAGITARGYLRSTKVWEYIAQTKRVVTPPKPEIWKVKVAVKKVVSSYMVYNSIRRNIEMKEIPVKGTFSSRYEAMKAVERYVAKCFSDEAIFNNKQGIFQECGPLLVQVSVDPAGEFTWHDSPLDDDIWWYSIPVDHDMPAITPEDLRLIPEFIVYKA